MKNELQKASIEQLKNCEDMHIWVKPIKDYIKELEAKEQRAKKLEELLGLYRECNEEGVFWLEIQGRISKLEEELK